MQAAIVARRRVELRRSDSHEGVLVRHGHVVRGRAAADVLEHGELEVVGPHDEVAAAGDDHPLPGALVQPKQLQAAVLWTSTGLESSASGGSQMHATL